MSVDEQVAKNIKRVPSSRKHDVAIYAPLAGSYYGEEAVIGGAEIQTIMLARDLVARGLRVAHIVYPLRGNPEIEEAPTLIERPAWPGRGRRAMAREALAIWQGLRDADAHSYVVRGGGGHVVVAAAFCRAHRRPLVFSSSNDLDFNFERRDRNRYVLAAYRRSLQATSRMVVQTRQQRELARELGFDPIQIPSFTQHAERSGEEPQYFLWANRLVHYKLPERYLDLAEALPEARFLMVAGETSETSADLARRVHERAERLPNLELVPSRPRAQLHDEMGRCTAVVTTSEVEGMPNMFLEAWARGIPVLSLNVDPDGGIEQHGLGLLGKGSMDRLVEGARSLWNDDRLRTEIGDRGRRFVGERHSIDAVGEQWAELLEELGSGRGQRPDRQLVGSR